MTFQLFQKLGKQEKKQYLLGIFEKVQYIYPIYKTVYDILQTETCSDLFLDEIYKAIEKLEQIHTNKTITNIKNVLDRIQAEESQVNIAEMEEIKKIEHILFSKNTI